jgi:hypothetical protein
MQQPNVVVCPHCDKEFIYNKVNGISLIQGAQDIEARKRVYIKLMLDMLESRLDTKEFPVVKKIVLDHFNDMIRDVHTILGFGVEAE